ncbi:hypothetical protein [Kordiimonas sp.]|uniref:hypothetical protein n=1 Tax=Kordiimonas sp. TaxID=1970157 RepID=UPI003A9444C7
MQELKRRKLALEGKRAAPGVSEILRVLDVATPAIGSVKLLPEKKRNGVRLLPVYPGKVKFSIEAPSYARFKCDIYTPTVVGVGKNAQFRTGRVRLYYDGTSGQRESVIDRGVLGNAAFLNLTLEDVKEFLQKFPVNVLHGNTYFDIEYLPHADMNLNALPQREALFKVKATPVR